MATMGVTSLFAINLMGSAFGLAVGGPLVTAARFATPWHRLLGALLLVSASVTALITLEHADVLGDGMWVSSAESLFALALGPLLFLYVRAATGAQRRVSAKALLHALPVVAGVVYLLAARWADVDARIRIEPVLTAQIVYTALALGAYRYTRGRPAEAAGPERFWPGVVVGFFVVAHVAQLLRLAYPNVAALREVVPLTATLGFLAVGGLGFVLSVSTRSSRTDVPTRPRYGKSSLREEAAPELVDRLRALMRTTKPYADAQLTLDRLAGLLDVPRHHLSQLLNQHLGVSFTEFVNGYRVAEASAQLVDPGNDAYTIDSIAESAGFGSRSNFYTVFRRMTGLTPTQYRGVATAEPTGSGRFEPEPTGPGRSEVEPR